MLEKIIEYNIILRTRLVFKVTIPIKYNSRGYKISYTMYKGLVMQSLAHLAVFTYRILQ